MSHLECRKNSGTPPSSGGAEKGDGCSSGRFVRTAPLPPHKKWPQAQAWGHFLSCGEEESNSTAARRRQAISPVGCCLVRGSHESGMSTGTSAADDLKLRLGVIFLSCGEEGSNSTAARRWQAISPAQRRRPQPAAETGRSCWGRVLIFQSPAKGLRKNQLTQPVAVA